MTDVGECGEEQKEEVKKLQDLVEKLEKQNEILRQKAVNYAQSPLLSSQQQQAHHTHAENGSTSINSNTDKKSAQNNSRVRKSSKSIGEGMDNLELHSDADDDDSWLYTSPLKAPTPDQKSVSPYDWIRQDFEKPNYDMESARKSLLAKLDEVSRANRNSLNLSKPQPIPEVPQDVNELARAPSPSRKPPETDQNTTIEEKLFKKLEDVTDVQILAKMQEESLRQALHQSPGTSPRARMTVSPASSENNLKSSSSRTSSQGSLEGVMEETPEAETRVTNVVRRRPSHERVQQVPMPTEQPTSANASLPEMNRMYGMKRVESEPPPPPPPTPCTENNPGLTQPSAGNHVTPQRGSLRQPSPTNAGRIPIPKRGIPVRMSPGQKTGIPRPRSAAYPKSQLQTPRSGIPARRASPQLKNDDWNEGCY